MGSAGGLRFEFNAFGFTVIYDGEGIKSNINSTLNLVPVWREIGFEFNLPWVAGLKLGFKAAFQRSELIRECRLQLRSKKICKLSSPQGFKSN